MKRTSIKDVAEAAGVSIATVSKALNGYSDIGQATREKIELIAKKLNYEPDLNAKSLSGKSNISIALLLSGLEKSDEGGFTFGIISGVYHSTLENGAEFMLLTTSSAKQNEKSYIQLCRQKNVDGVVVIGIRTDDPYYEEVSKSQIPCVLIDVLVEENNISTVSTNNEQAAYDAVNFLIEHGHKHIGMLNGTITAEVSKKRFNGYAKAFSEHDILLDLNYVAYTDFDETSSYKETLKLIRENNEITAIFCASDLIAIGAIKAIEKIGKKVPNDISIIGFDDITIAKYINGGLTTIKQDPFALGKTAGEKVFKILQKEEVPNHSLVPYQLMDRNTVKNNHITSSIGQKHYI